MLISEILDAAIRNEINAQRLYRHLGAIMANERSSQFMKRLEAEEQEHEKRLRSLREADASNQNVEPDHPLLEAEISRAHSVYVTIDESASVDDLLQLAARREERARLLYERLAKAVDEGALRELFTQLAADERAHEEAVIRIARSLKDAGADR